MDEPKPGSTASSAPAGFPEAVAIQIRNTCDVLRADAAAEGLDAAAVDDAIARALDTYAGVRVHTYLGILVGRDVRAQLGLHPARTRTA